MKRKRNDPTVIRIRGANQNNLKDLDLDIPLNRITVVTGPSGSGKSSLAFDTLYAEGQRRYVETFSPYARQFMDRMDRPLVDRIENIPPAIAIDRKDPVRTSRSTVGTMTELTDYVKLLYARTGRLHCRRCGKPVAPETPEHVWKALAHLKEGTEILLTFPIPATGSVNQARKELGRMGYTRVFQESKLFSIEDVPPDAPWSCWNVLADRVLYRISARKRIMDSVEQAFRYGGGRLDVWATPEGQEKKELPLSFSNRLECAPCGITYRSPLPNLFSFNSPVGACSTCRGFGKVLGMDLGLIIPDPTLSIDQGAIKPWGGVKEGRGEYRELKDFCRRSKIPTHFPFQDLAEADQQAIIQGAKGYYGIRGFFDWLQSKSYKMHVRVYLSRYRTTLTCPDCGGTRFKEETLLYKFGGLTIAEVYRFSVDEASRFFQAFPSFHEDRAAALILQEIQSRLLYLKDVGLGYLSLDRQSRTLSGGEVERVALTAALGSSLVNTLYVLDEPSIGLHPRDSHRLMRILQNLRDLQNTVVIVEHDPEIISRSDFMLDLGPGAGEQGGKIMYFGPTAWVKNSLTGRYLKGELSIPVPTKRRKPGKNRWLVIQEASENNLKGIDARIPLGCFVCLTGVSGSGKSTLAEEIIYKGIKRAKGNGQGSPGRHSGILGLEKIDDAVLVDQRPIGRTPRANPLTYVKAMDSVRSLLMRTDQARAKGFGKKQFSFNVAGGRCETCQGTGFEKVEMQFLSDVFITCPDCGGRRFKKEVLEVCYRGKNIHDILSMTVDEAMVFFNNQAALRSAFQPLLDVGLGYMRLGQPIHTLSGGEAQRLKLSQHLRNGAAQRNLFIFDEPTTGLHFEDIQPLLAAFQRLVDQGNTVLVIEHNMDVIKTADWVIDLGPEGGEAGGWIVAEGPPETLKGHPGSHTGAFLHEYLRNTDRLLPGRSSSPPKAALREEHRIAVVGAREHNLRDLKLTIPTKKLVVVTGVSGSGKSTLVFDIVFAEGQRRYLESLAPYVRQYVRILERPDVDTVDGLPPTVAIQQRISHSSLRSTVATLTEIYHFLRLLFSKLGVQHCPGCDRPLKTQTMDQIISQVKERFGKQKAMLLAPKIMGRKGFHKDLLARALKGGYGEARIDGRLTTLRENMALSRYHEHTIELVAGRLPGRDTPGMVRKAVEEGNGSMILLPGSGPEEILSLRGLCPVCGIGVQALDPRLFSFNSKQGACTRCDGLGRLGEGNSGRVIPCPKCGGSRLKAEALSVKVKNQSIWDLVRQPADALLETLKSFSFASHEAQIADPIMTEILVRLAFLNRLGLSYLSLDRSGDTLSGGEAQRIRLSAQLGSNLTGVCYILDEPTIGLHPRDNRILLDALKELRDRGNSILLVEHDEETIREADHLIDLGPGAGRQGGRVVASGSLKDLQQSPASATGASFNGRPHKITSRLRPCAGRAVLTVRGAREHNLKNLDVDFPLGLLICVTGVSGSGKSTLLKDTLFTGTSWLLSRKKQEGAPWKSIEGWEALDRILEVNHSPIGYTPRSVPASYVGFLSQIRNLMAMTPEARARGYRPGRFSFNTPGGRCEICKGHGSVKVEMSFLPHVYVHCEVCNGRRFNQETLDITYKGKNVGEILDFTFEEAEGFFAAVPMIRRALKVVCDMGLGYLRIGQPSPTLSGGEAQRVKLAEELSKPSRGKTLYVLDEPTTGLHVTDVNKLLTALQALVDHGNTVAVIEHNMEVIKEADYIIDLGPEGGERGGRIVTTGSPLELLAHEDGSYTARYLRKYLNESKHNKCSAIARTPDVIRGTEQSPRN